MGGDEKSRRVVTGPDPVRRDRLVREMDTKGYRIREQWAGKYIEPAGTPKSTPPETEYSYRSSRASSTYGGEYPGHPGGTAWDNQRGQSNFTPSLPPSSHGRSGDQLSGRSGGSGRSGASRDELREQQLKMAQAALTATGGQGVVVRTPPASSHGRGPGRATEAQAESPTASASAVSAGGSRVTAPSYLGSSFSRFTGFYSPLQNIPMGKLTQAENFRDAQLTQQIVQDSQEETSHRKKKDWMKAYQDESVKFAAVTRTGGAKASN